MVELAYIDAHEDIRIFIEKLTDILHADIELAISNTTNYSERFKPDVAINPHAYKVHGLSMLKLLKCRPSTEITLPIDTKYIIGHNISFDYRMLGKPENILLIDTLVITRILRKLGLLTNDDADAKDALDTLIKHYFPTIAETLVKPLHSALDDCLKVVLLLSEILRLFPNINTWEELYELQIAGKKK